MRSVSRLVVPTFPTVLRPFSTASTPATQPFRVAVVGSGPSGFYSAKYLLKDDPTAHVDILDALPSPYGACKLFVVGFLSIFIFPFFLPLQTPLHAHPSHPPPTPTPTGLVRSGVAPDHPEVKQVTNDFEEVAKDPRFGFMGHVRVGEDVGVGELLQHYHAVVFAYGASSDRDMGIPGEDLGGVHSARAFVNWYNGHPAYRDFAPNLDTEDVVIVGNGNVAIDCARVLCKDVGELGVTDIAAHAVEALKRSRVKRVHVVGRRGHVQAAMTMKELRELTKLEGTRFSVSPEELGAGRNPASMQELEAQRARKRMDALLTEQVAAPPKPASKELTLRFLLSPKACKAAAGAGAGSGGAAAPGGGKAPVGSFEFERVRLEGGAEKQKAVGTGEVVTIPAGLVLKSIGYKSLAMPGVPFDTRSSTIPNAAGRVLQGAGGEVVPGMYCTGWVKRGPSGIIGTNITDARETVACVLEDKGGRIGAAAAAAAKGGLLALKALLKAKGVSTTTSLLDWAGWLKVDKEEVSRGTAKGKSREKVVSVAEMLTIGTKQ